MKTPKANKKKSRKGNPLPHCGGFQKMADMMKTCCQDEGGAIDCRSMMLRMMGHGKGAEAKETKETQKPPKGGEKG